MFSIFARQAAGQHTIAKTLFMALLFSLSTFASPLLAPAFAASPPTQRLPVWIDTDPSCGNSFTQDVDDCLALLQAINSPELDIVGIGTVFGNANHTTTSSIARHIVREFGCAQLQAVCPSLVYSGAQNRDTGFQMTQATQALANLLQEQRVTILALGPLTNIATLLVHHPELRDRIVQVVAVAGRRPGQTFTPNAARFISLADRNFEEDPISFDIVLRSGIPLTLTPYEVASKVTMSQYDLEQLSAGPPASRWLSQQAQRWFQLWYWVLGAFPPCDA